MRFNNFLVVVLVAGTDLAVNAAPVNGHELVRLADGRVLSRRDPDWKTTAKTTALDGCSVVAGIVALACHQAGDTTGTLAAGAVGIAAQGTKFGVNLKKTFDERKKEQSAESAAENGQSHSVASSSHPSTESVSSTGATDGHEEHQHLLDAPAKEVVHTVGLMDKTAKSKPEPKASGSHHA